MFNYLAAALMDWVPGIITALLSGGLGASLVAWYKVPAERGQIIVTAAQGALIVQTGVIKTLEEQIDRISQDNKELRNKLEIVTTKNEELETLVERQAVQIASLTANQIRHDEEVKTLQKKV